MDQNKSLVMEAFCMAPPFLVPMFFIQPYSLRHHIQSFVYSFNCDIWFDTKPLAFDAEFCQETMSNHFHSTRIFARICCMIKVAWTEALIAHCCNATPDIPRYANFYRPFLRDYYVNMRHFFDSKCLSIMRRIRSLTEISSSFASRRRSSIWRGVSLMPC